MSDGTKEADLPIEETEAYKRWIETAEECAGSVLLNKEIGIPENGTGAHRIACELIAAEQQGYQAGRASLADWCPNPHQQLKFLRFKRDMMYDYMEGTNAEEFARWEKLYCAYSDIVRDMEKELLAAPETKEKP